MMPPHCLHWCSLYLVSLVEMDPSSGDTRTLGDRSHVRRIVRMQQQHPPHQQQLRHILTIGIMTLARTDKDIKKKTLTGAPDKLSEKVR